VLSRQKRHKPEFLQRLERRIIELLPSGQALSKIVATDLGMSERTWREGSVISARASAILSTGCGMSWRAGI
jgi:hypothetical protein